MADRHTDDTFSEVSLLLMEIFHKLGVNDKIRCRRKNTWKQYEKLRSFIHTNVRGTMLPVFYSKVFGSQIEGSTTPGLQSDVDIVHFITDFLARRNMQDAVTGMINFLIVSDEHTFPGYFKLQWLGQTQNGVKPLYRGDVDLNESMDVDHKGRIVLKFSTCARFEEYDRHGPAVTLTQGPIKSDTILGIRVNSWVQEAIPWLMRHRQCSWITPDDLENFLKKEAFLVPVGHPLSIEKNFEWRISFTSVERELMWRLNNTQMACYILMKIIIKSFITPTTGECLSSYHCKTALFYLVNNTEKNLWKPNNLLSCLRLLLKTISVMVKEGLCPNYFIPQENMFLGKMTEPVRQQLYQILVSLIDMEFKYLLLIECDQLGQTLSNACTRLYTLQETPSDMRHLVTVTQDKTSVFCIDTIVLYEVNNVLISGYTELLQLSDQNVSQNLMYTLIHGFQTGSGSLKDMLSVLIAFLSSHIGCQLASSCFASQNFHPQDMDKVHKFLLIGTGSDVTSGKLKLAGFYLKLGYPAQAETVLSAVEQELVHHVSEVSVQNLCVNDLEESVEKILSENLKTSQIFKTCIAAAVTYLPSEIHITLPPLCYEMFRSVGADPALRDPEKHYWYDWAVVDARSYLYFLQYQTYSDLGMDECKRVALLNLAWSITHKKTRSHDTCLNMLAYCLRQKGELELALLVLSKSLKIKPEHNAAVWQICDLFNQLYHS